MSWKTNQKSPRVQHRSHMTSDVPFWDQINASVLICHSATALRTHCPTVALQFGLLFTSFPRTQTPHTHTHSPSAFNTTAPPPGGEVLPLVEESEIRVSKGAVPQQSCSGQSLHQILLHLVLITAPSIPREQTAGGGASVGLFYHHIQTQDHKLTSHDVSPGLKDVVVVDPAAHDWKSREISWRKTKHRCHMTTQGYSLN